MGDFQRSRSKVWWSSFPEDDDDLLVHHPPAHPVARAVGDTDTSVSRGSSSSPSSSHKSQDSGFSDSEHSPASSVVTPSSPPPRRLPTLDESLTADLTAKSTRFDVVDAPTPPRVRRRERDVAYNSRARLSLPPVEYLDLRPVQQPYCFNLNEPPGTPGHTSTPKASTSSSSSSAAVCRRQEAEQTSKRSAGTSGKKHARPVNLLEDFNSTTDQLSKTEFEEEGPVHHWLEEIVINCESECMTTLQSKSLAVDLSHQVAKMSAETMNMVRELQEKTRIISNEFAKLVQQLECDQMEHVAPLVQSILGNIVEFIYDYGNKQKTPDNKDLVQSCDKLRRAAGKKPICKEEIMDDIAAVGQLFTNIVDTVLTRQIKTLVSVLEEPSSEMALRSALASLTTLGLDGTHLSCLVTNCGGIRALLAVCLESNAGSVRVAVLRTLATVCCTADTIRQLEQSGGIEILTEILSEEKRSEQEMTEAAAVLAQITAPWVEDNHSIQGLATHLPMLIKSLTRLLSGTRSNETLLLSAAALANMTFMAPQSVWSLLDHSTAAELLNAVRKQGPNVSIFLQEQAATLLANMASIPEARPFLAEAKAVVALLCFLQIRHSPLQRAPEIAAAERVQQKSAIALSRLCSDPVVAIQVVELQGVSRLVRLCKEERERNHSDGVLVACLAALRKIAANCGTKVIEDLDAMELVEPQLLDSFLIYSSRQESYV